MKGRWFVCLAVALAAVTGSTASWADDQFKVLVLAMPSKYHYEYIPVARDSLEHMARQHAFGLTFTSDAAVLDTDLKAFAAVVMLDSAPDDLTASERSHVEAYMQGGGNMMIVHRAAVVQPNSWPWYEKLVGRSFVNHPMLQTAIVTVADKGFPAASGLPDRWVWSDEYYVTANPFGVAIHPVLEVDETSYDPTRIWPGQVGHRMGRDHPEAWYHAYEKGRVFVTLLGHNADDYSDRNYLDHLLGGIYWTATGLGQAH